MKRITSIWTAVICLACVAQAERFEVSQINSGQNSPIPFLDGYLRCGSAGSAANVYRVKPGVEGSVLLIQGGSPALIGLKEDVAIFLTQNQPQARREIWKTDGTPEGTAMIKTDTTGTLFEAFSHFGSGWSGFPAYFHQLSLPQNGQLWISDGTESGTRPVEEATFTVESQFQIVGQVGPHLLWIAPPTQEGGSAKLWGCNGNTGAVTELGETPADAHEYAGTNTNLDGVACFLLGREAAELWRSDGTPEGSFKLASLPEEHPSGTLRAGNGWLVCQSENAQPSERHFIITDGSVEGTRSFTPANLPPLETFVIAPVSGNQVFVAQYSPEDSMARYGYANLTTNEFIDVFGPRTIDTYDLYFMMTVFSDRNIAEVDGSNVLFPIVGYVVSPRGDGTVSRYHTGLARATPAYDSAEILSCRGSNDQARAAIEEIRRIEQGYVALNRGWDLHLRQAEVCKGESDARHTIDIDADDAVSLSELLRLIQFYNYGGYQCAAQGEQTEDGFKPGGIPTCGYHDADYQVPRGDFSLSEVLRVVQFYNSDGFYWCPKEYTEDDFCVGLPPAAV